MQMAQNGGGDVVGLDEAFFGLFLCLAQPGDIEIVATGGNGLAGELAPAAGFAFIRAALLAIGVLAECLLKPLEMGRRQRRGLLRLPGAGLSIVSRDREPHNTQRPQLLT